MNTYTVDEFLAFQPCASYTRERLLEIWGGRDRLSALDMLREEGVPAQDRIWAITLPGVMTREQAKAWLARVVQRARHCGITSVEIPEYDRLDAHDRSQAIARATDAMAAARARAGAGAWARAWAWAAGAMAGAWARAWARAWAGAMARARARAEAAWAEERRNQVQDALYVLEGTGQ